MWSSIPEGCVDFDFDVLERSANEEVLWPADQKKSSQREEKSVPYSLRENRLNYQLYLYFCISIT
jgi:hypothetical protein